MVEAVPSPAAGVAETHRLFFALLPPAEVIAAIGEHRASVGLTRGFISDDRLHMTLAITDDHDTGPPPPLTTAALAAGAAVRSAPIHVLLDEAVGGAGTIVLRSHEKLDHLFALQRRLASSLSAAGVPMRRGWRFNPHVTIGYRRGAPFAAPILPISWRAQDLVLIHSHVGLTRHDILARWPLVGT